MSVVGTNSVVVGADVDAAVRWTELARRFGTPLLAFDRDRLADRYRALAAALPGVDLHYAIKALPAPAVISALDALGSGFDLASAGEAELLRDARVSARRTIHTHPVKKDADIRAALRFGTTTMVVDNIEELDKLVPYRSRVGVLVRVAFTSGGALINLSRKFGCGQEEVATIVAAARLRGLHVKGLSFHVGSQCDDAQGHAAATTAAARLMLELSEHTPMSVLDIGGGFPAAYAGSGVDIHAFCAPLRRVLAGLPADWQVIAEPGRFLVADAVTGVFSVMGRSLRGGQPWYFLDDGVYGSFSGQMFDHVRYPLEVLVDGPTEASMLAGPTCDSIDMIAENVQLPRLAVGDLVIGHTMGAYTAATRTHFNLLNQARFVDVRAEDALALELPAVAAGGGANVLPINGL